MKKALTAVLAASMLLTATACNGSTTSSSSAAPAPSGSSSAAPASSAGGESSTASQAASSDPITIKAFQYLLENQQVDLDNLWFYQELEKKTNVHVEWEGVMSPPLRNNGKLIVSQERRVSFL